MTNLMLWLLDNLGRILLLVTVVTISWGIFTNCTLPHDFGNYNTLKTICHVWKGRDGYRRQATQHINSSKNIHGSHPWDYDGECER